MFSGVRRSLRMIDFYQAVPTGMSEGTISGACISVVSISVLVLLTAYSFWSFMTPGMVSDLIIDQKHLSQKLRVSIDIEFPKYPCSFLSLDIENVLKVHLVNIDENLQKRTMPEMEIYNDRGLNNEQRLQRVLKDAKEQKGCRMNGTFEIDRVPGNFHFSCHGYANILPSLMNSGIRSL